MTTRTRIAATAVAILATSAPLATAAATVRHQPEPAWERALFTRSRALDRGYRLGSFRPLARGLHLTTTQRNSAWLRALQLRSQGLDCVHHLGSFAAPPKM
ncbi:MAG: hypothetical protein ACTHQQ_11215 [Solirubrobacteraceae bacterium]